MEQFQTSHIIKSKSWDVQFEPFKKSAQKNHKESLWILNIVKDVKNCNYQNEDVSLDKLTHSFATTPCTVHEGLGWYFAGWFSIYNSVEKFNFYKMSSDSGYSWAQVEYSEYFCYNYPPRFVERNLETYKELLLKAAAQNNPKAYYKLYGYGFCFVNDSSHLDCAVRAAELGCISHDLCYHRTEKQNLIQGLKWIAQTKPKGQFLFILRDALKAMHSDTTVDLLPIIRRYIFENNNLNKLIMELGKCVYWWHIYLDNDDKCDDKFDDSKFYNSVKSCAKKCLDYYCLCIDLQQESIFLFLHFWNKNTNIKDVGKMIGKLVWNDRYVRGPCCPP